MKKNLSPLIIIILILIFLICISSFIIFGMHQNTKPLTSELADGITVSTSEENYTYKNPIVPQGFNKVQTSSASWKLENGFPKGWNSGLVIEDQTGNQFVWIPINIEDLNYTLTGDTDFHYTADNLPETIKKYGGFYVSRYEAGVPYSLQNNLNNISSITNDVIDVPVSKKGVMPWNFISYNNAYLSAKKMYCTDSYSSNLISFPQTLWILNWLESSGYNITNSTDWGNYSDAHFICSGLYSEDSGKNYKYSDAYKKSQYTCILSSGATDRNMANNIYDFAGNLWEFTSTNFSNSKYYYSYGGYYATPGIQRPAYCINAYSLEPSDNIGFRICLDIK